MRDVRKEQFRKGSFCFWVALFTSHNPINHS